LSGATPVYDYVIGVDIGLSFDYTAVVALRRTILGNEPILYDTVLAQKKRRITIPELIRRITEMVSKPPLAYHTTLVVERNNVGPGVIDPLREKLSASSSPARLISGFVTMGDVESSEGWQKNVPKRDLIAACTVVLDDGRLRTPKTLPGSPGVDQLQTELRQFTFHNKGEGVTKYGSENAAIHDDFVMALGWALWYGENHRRPYAPILTIDQQLEMAVTSEDPNVAHLQYLHAMRKLNRSDAPQMVHGRFTPQRGSR